MRQPVTTRRRLLFAVAALPFAALAQPVPKKVLVEVWKDPSCGCCQDWVKHLQDHGFAVKVNQNGNDAMRAKLGMPEKLASCHTALVGGYAIEGHVPAADIRRLLKDRAGDARGFARHGCAHLRQAPRPVRRAAGHPIRRTPGLRFVQQGLTGFQGPTP